MEQMGIIKMEVSIPEARKALQEFKISRLIIFEEISSEIKKTVSSAINQLLNLEMNIFLGKADQLNNKKNGYKYRDYTFKGIGCIRLKMPQDRKGKFSSGILPTRERKDPRIQEDMALLHLAGISTRTLEMISKRVLGIEISKSAVSNSLDLIYEKALLWLERPLTEEYWALYIDGTNFSIQRRGSTEKEPSLVVLGVNSKNKKSILAIEPGDKESAECWRTVFKSLKQRGLKADKVQIGIMDGLPGLEKVFKEEFSSAVTARCWVHAMKNALNKTPKRLQEPFKVLLHRVMYASSEAAGKVAFYELKTKFHTDATRAVSCIEKDLDSLLAHFKFKQSFWIALKTTNPIERINKELKQRTKTMGSLGESTLTCIVAFTALKLEMNWKRHAINEINFKNLKQLQNRENINTVETAFTELVH